MASVELVEVGKRYGDGHEAVSDLDLQVADGEFLILVGPSGCGKSTVLRMIAGLEEVSTGELRIGGELVNDWVPKDRDVAMVFQGYALYPHMSVRDNMRFALKIAGLERGEIDARIEGTAAMLGLTEHLNRKPGRLSGGQRQRVAMGRAIVREPRAFLMDEPLSNLDAKLRLQIRSQIGRLQRRLGVTTVYVTHDQTEAMTLGDRVAVLNDGVLQQVGEPIELYERPANLFVADFMGSPPMNFISAVLERGRLRLTLGEVDIPEAPEGERTPRRLIAGVRPEAFEDAALLNGDHNGRLRFRATVDVLESIGSELYAHLEAPAGGPPGRTVRPDTDGLDLERHELVARLDARSRAREGAAAEICLDPRRIHLFDPISGERLARRNEA